jgi:hypothetical protein
VGDVFVLRVWVDVWMGVWLVAAVVFGTKHIADTSGSRSLVGDYVELHSEVASINLSGSFWHALGCGWG